MDAIDSSTVARFWACVDRAEPNACWLWKPQHSHASDGRGSFAWRQDGKQVRLLAPRMAWLLTHGALPAPGVCVCHTCDVPACVNPAHLWLGTRGDNNRDRVAKGRPGAQHPVAALRRCYRCEQTRPLDEFAVAKDKPGGRSYLCRPCHLAWRREYMNPYMRAYNQRRRQATVTDNLSAGSPECPAIPMD